MSRHATGWVGGVLLIVIAGSLGLSLQARQAGDPEDLGVRLRERYDVVAIQGGVGLIPLDRDAAVRLVEIRGGAVTVNGEALTGGELRDRFGDDADLILRATYLDAPGQQQLLGDGQNQPAVQDVPPPTVTRRSRSEGDAVRIMGNVTVARDERIDGDVVAVMGNARIDGEVSGDVTVVMGNVSLGDDAVVMGDLNVVGGTLNRAPGARVDGDVNNVGLGGGVGAGPWSPSGVPGMLRDSMLGRLGSFAGTLTRVTLLGLLALLVAAVGRTAVERIADRAAAEPVRAGLVGFVAQLLFLPLLVMTVVVLAVSIIGIPLLLLLPFGLLLLVVVLLVGYTGVAYHVGGLLNDRFGWAGRGPYATVALGVVAIVLVTVLARAAAVAGGGFFGMPLSAVGYLVEYLAWTLGFGAAVLAWLQQRRTPPPVVAG